MCVAPRLLFSLQLIRIMVAAFGTAALFGCDNTAAPHADPDLATYFRIRIEATGGDFDLDGFEIVIDSKRTVPIGPGGRLDVNRVSAGAHELRLGGVADNCAVTSANPVSVTAVSNAITPVVFAMKCDVTGVDVQIRTSGVDFPFTFTLLVDQSQQSVTVNSTLAVTRLSPGGHTVSLGQPPDNCRILSENPVTVAVSYRSLTPVAFDATCVRTEKRLAFVLDSIASFHVGNWILITDSLASNIVPLTDGDGPAWSPDGSKIAYSKVVCDFYYGTGCTGGLIMIDPATRETNVIGNGEAGRDPAWSPDGTTLAFSRLSKTRQDSSTLTLLRLNGSVATPLPSVALGVGKPSWSSDGRRIVFECRFTSSAGPGSYEICLINADGTGFVRLTVDAAVDTSPAWSPDGTRIAFSSNRFGPKVEILFMDSAGENVRRLTPGFAPSWWPDGSKLVLSNDDGLFTIRPDGSGLTRLTTGRHSRATIRP